VHCIDCGFLTAGIDKPITHGGTTSETEWVKATPHHRSQAYFEEVSPWFGCARPVPSFWPDDESAYKGVNWLEVIHKPRRCDKFERDEHPMTIEWHMESWKRRQEQGRAEVRSWARLVVTALVSLASER
jgi:hypothetical protein